MTADPELARKILIDAGADASKVRVEQKPFGWLVAAAEFGAGCSSEKIEALDTPQEVAAQLVLLRGNIAGGVFDSGPTLQEVREAYEDSHTIDEGAGDVGIAEHTGADIGGDAGEHVEALEDDPAGGDPDFSAEPVGDDLEPGDEHQTEDVSPPNFGGVLVSGDPLKAAQMEATWAVGDKEEALVSQYAADENLARLNEMRGIALAIKEGVHPAFDEETAAELQALETFASWLSAVRANADRLRNAIRMASTIEDVQAVNLEHGWPE